ncbi:MAG: Smr/MutS family protein [Candidatus Sumerlaeia bacterium]|nr:Smr/MutS family protein [Candidatus Sumerlaeia bacterium]
MDARTRDALELDRLLEHLAGHAQSPPGAAVIRALEPAVDPAAVALRLKRSGEALALLDSGKVLPLGGLEDIGPLLGHARIVGSVLGPEEWMPLRRFLAVAHDVRDYATRHADTYPTLARLILPLVETPELIRAIDRVFDADGLVRDDASRDLARIRSDRRRHEAHQKRTVQRLLETLRGHNVLQDDFTTLRDGRHVFPVRASARSRLPGIVHATSGTGETVYVEPNEVVEVSNRLELVRQEEQQEINRLLRELTAELRPHLPDLESNLEILAQVDAVQGLARHAARRSWKIPVVAEGGALKLFAAHHPLLHVLHPDESVPITVTLEQQDRLLLLSGPNAGGKTTAMKTIALCAVLVQCGSPIPASPDSRIPIFDAVLADIGDQQDLGEGLSTFTGHVRRLKEVMAAAGRRSLVLFDELGTGTDPEEGGALAQAVLEELVGRAGLTLTTSHLGPLKKWAEDTPGARNASFGLDPATQRPAFRLRLDLPGASEALIIARNEGLPTRLLERARSLVGEQKAALGELIHRIEERERLLGDALRETEARAQALEQQEKLAQHRAEQLREERRRFKAEALDERDRLLREARERLERLIADLPGEEELRQRKDALNRARGEALAEQQRITAERRLLERPAPTSAPEPGGLRSGARVWVRPLRAWATVLTLDPDTQKARVLIGSVEADVRLDDLQRRAPEPVEVADTLDSEPVAAPEAKRRKKKSRRLKAPIEQVATSTPSLPVNRPTPRRAPKPPSEPPPEPTPTTLGNTLVFRREHVPLELDLHGYRVDEALAALDRYLDRALLADYPHVRIVHGTGEGRLYRAVHEFLRGCRHVKRFRFGTPDEGGGGCTIVEF